MIAALVGHAVSGLLLRGATSLLFFLFFILLPLLTHRDTAFTTVPSVRTGPPRALEIALRLVLDPGRRGVGVGGVDSTAVVVRLHLVFCRLGSSGIALEGVGAGDVQLLERSLLRPREL